MMFQVSQAASRIPQLAIPAAQKPNENQNEKFGSTNPFFKNTATELAHW